jgi:iron complex outermembrane recepter protein
MGAHHYRSALRRLCGYTAMSLLWAPLAHAEHGVHFEIRPQSLRDALAVFMQQSGSEILFASDVVEGKWTQGLSGELTPTSAIATLLRGTDLTYKITEAGAVLVVPAGETAASARAQGSADGILQEVIVTARKREESVQDVPAAVSVLGEQKLERIGADSFEGFARTVPGLNLTPIGPSQSNVNIRGVSTTATNTAAQSTVAFYVDDLPTLDSFLSIATPDLRLFDVARVEVLRGPQGTLFGSGALSGAIRIITNKPNLAQTEFAVETGFSSIEHGDFSYQLNAMANLPIFEDRFAVRLVGYMREEGGYVDNVLPGGHEDQNSAQAHGGRVSMRLQATDQLRLTATSTYQKNDIDDAPNSFYSRADGGAYQNDNYSSTGGVSKLTTHNLVAEYDLGLATVTSSTTYGETEVATPADGFSRVLSVALGLPTPVAIPVINFSDANAFAQELRVASNGDNRIDYVVGAFYLQRQFDRGQTFPSPLPGVVIFDIAGKTQTREQALFGEVNIGLTDRLDLTLGGRAFSNEFELTSTSTGLLSGLPQGVVVTGGGSTDESGFNPKIVLSYRYSSEGMVYAQVARGYRTGFVNIAVGSNSAVPYDSDTLTNYELGLKSYWLDRRLLLNAAAYYIDWQDVQINAQRVINGILFAGIANAGAAQSRGLEVEAIWAPSRRWELSTALAFNDTELTQIDRRFVVNALEGDELPAAPNFTAANTIQYSFDLGSWNSYARVDHQYVGEALSGFKVAPGPIAQPVTVGDYHLVNFRLGFTRGNLELAAYVNNLNGSDGIIIGAAAGNLNPATSIRVLPRTIGALARVRFCGRA